jgi:hypothetical protein
MPVLSEPPSRGIANLPDITLTYVFLGALFLVLVGIYISRRAKTTQYSVMASSSEKEPLMNNSNNNNNENPGSESQSAAPVSPAKPRIQRPPQPLPFTPPMLEQAPTEMTFSSFEAMEIPPRRRSYTKIMADGTEVSGEIIAAEGWRRHTKVFGGGVCKACEENDRRMTA